MQISLYIDKTSTRESRLGQVPSAAVLVAVGLLQVQLQLDAVVAVVHGLRLGVSTLAETRMQAGLLVGVGRVCLHHRRQSRSHGPLQQMQGSRRRVQRLHLLLRQRLAYYTKLLESLNQSKNQYIFRVHNTF
jgi:hypothetical protein